MPRAPKPKDGWKPECYARYNSNNRMSQVRFLNPAEISLQFPPGAVHPRLTIQGDRTLLHARLFRCFPLTSPDAFISIQDESGRELGIMKDLAGLDPDSRKALDEYMDRRYFTPIIEKITALTQEASMWRWEVSTQRGISQFYIRGVRDSVHEVAPKRWQVVSIDGQRYEIRNFDELDAKSRDLFESLF